MTTTKKTALCGVFTGLSLALMWTLSVIPWMDYTAPALAGLLVFVLVLHLNWRWAAAVYVASSVLSALLLPNKSIAVIYILVFGGYPLLRHALQRLPKWLAWLCKLAAFNAAMLASYYFAVFLFGIDLAADFGWFGQFAILIVLALGNLTFLLYDAIILDTFALIYRKRWQKKLQHYLK